jgi:predicted PurR-regulated permease PerM
MNPSNFYRPVQQAFLILLLAMTMAVAGTAIYSTRWILIAALLGIGFGTILSPVMRLLHDRLKIPRPVSAALFLLLFLCAGGALTYVLYIAASHELFPLIQNAPALLKQAQATLLQWSRELPWVQNAISRINFAEPFQRVTGALVSGVGMGATVIGGVFFVLFNALYVAVNPGLYRDGFLSLFPAHLRARVALDLKACGQSLRTWFFAQVIAAAIVGSLTAIGLLTFGLDMWLAGGLLTFALDFIPYVGPIVAGLIISLLTLGSEPDKILPALGVLVVMQQVESNLVIPLVMKGRVDLPPVQLITIMLMFGSWFGILGVLIAPPLLTVMRTLYLREYAPWMNARQTPASMEPPDAVKRSA